MISIPIIFLLSLSFLALVPISTVHAISPCNTVGCSPEVVDGLTQPALLNAGTTLVRSLTVAPATQTDTLAITVTWTAAVGADEGVYLIQEFSGATPPAACNNYVTNAWYEPTTTLPYLLGQAGTCRYRVGPECNVHTGDTVSTRYILLLRDHFRLRRHSISVW